MMLIQHDYGLQHTKKDIRTFTLIAASEQAALATQADLRWHFPFLCIFLFWTSLF